MTPQQQQTESDSYGCSQCDHIFDHDDLACEVLSGRSGNGLGKTTICTKCAKKAGVDVAAFARPAPELIPELA